MNEIHVTVVGRLVADPESRETQGGVPFAAFRLASSSRRFNPSSSAWEESPASYLNVTAFRTLGANVAASLKKGHPVVVHGRMRVSQYTRGDGNPGTSVEVDAYSVGHDLSSGTTVFTRVSRAQVEDHDRLADANVQAALRGEDAPAGTGHGGGLRPVPDAATVPYVIDDGLGPVSGGEPDGEPDHEPADLLGSGESEEVDDRVPSMA